MPDCPYCFEPMKPLFQSFFCINDCDRPEGQARLAKKKQEDNKYTHVIPASWHFFPAYTPGAAP